MRKLYLLPLLLFLALTSCKEEKDDPAPQPEPEAPTPQPDLKVRTVTFDFMNDLVPWESDGFELIVSQKDGKVLLDTLLWQTTNHVLKVRSNDTKFDITTIYQHPPSKEYSIRTYVQVDPDNWKIGHVEFWNRGETEAAEIQFINVTPPTPDYRFQSELFSVMNSFGYSKSTWDGKGTLTLNYQRSLPTDTAYLMLTALGKYIFAPVTSSKTQVDFSEAKDATEHRLNTPADASWPIIFLDGHPREGDYSKRMLLYFGSADHFLYPSTGIAEFNMRVTYDDAEYYNHEYFYVGKSMPTDLGFETKADFSVTKAEFNDFQIQFGEEVPASYFMEWASEALKVKWRIYLSPEETAFKPQDYLQNLSAAHLEGIVLSGFSPKSVTSYKAQGYTHQSLHDYLNNPDAIRRYELKQYRTIEKEFR